MGLMLAAGLLLGASTPCEPRPGTAAPPPASPFSVLGGPVLDGLARCGTGQVPGEPSPGPSAELQARTERGADEHDCAPQGCWAWAGWNERRPVRGAGARLSIEAPEISAPDHSLAEVAIQWGRADHDIVEIGWEVAPHRHGDAAPHLFVHRWSDGRPCSGPCGFQRWSPRLWPGMSLARWKGKEVALGWLLDRGRAWAWADGEWLGSFGIDGEDRHPVARVAQWFGEVFFVRPPPRIPMGNGLPADAPAAARISAVCDVPAGEAICKVRRERLPRVSEPEVYSLWTASDGGFRYGGPLRPRPPPSSASGGTPSATGR
jgi:hypothetical protein